MNAQPLDTYINIIYSENRDLAPILSKVIGRKFSDESSADVNLRCGTNLTCDAVLADSTNFANLGLSYI